MSTTEAKKRFELSTDDLCRIQGFRRPVAHYGGGNNLTLYYHSDLVAAAVKKWGQEHFDNRVPEGREMSGAAGKVRDAKAQKEATAAQEARDNAPYSAVPAERLCNVKLYNLQKILERLEGGKRKPHCGTRDAAIERIMRAGYSQESEAAFQAKQKVIDEAAAAKKKREYEAYRAEQERKAGIAKEKAEKARANMMRRMALFEKDLLDPDDLEYKELQYQLKRMGCPGNGSRLELESRLVAALAAKKAEEEAAAATKDAEEEAAAAKKTEEEAAAAKKAEEEAAEAALKLVPSLSTETIDVKEPTPAAGGSAVEITPQVIRLNETHSIPAAQLEQAPVPISIDLTEASPITMKKPVAHNKLVPAPKHKKRPASSQAQASGVAKKQGVLE